MLYAASWIVGAHEGTIACRRETWTVALPHPASRVKSDGNNMG